MSSSIAESTGNNNNLFPKASTHLFAINRSGRCIIIIVVSTDGNLDAPSNDDKLDAPLADTLFAVLMSLN